MLPKLSIILILLLAFSCNEKYSSNTSIYVYKTKNNYSNNVPVELSEDKTKITSAPGFINTRWPVLLFDEYCLNGSMGSNTGYLSITITEFNNNYTNIGVDSLYKLLIDVDPFVSFYYRDDDNGAFHDDNGAFGIDTVFINELIRNNELEKYFEKLK